eukprot:3074125-Prymnesium_polylepis.1
MRDRMDGVRCAEKSLVFVSTFEETVRITQLEDTCATQRCLTCARPHIGSEAHPNSSRSTQLIAFHHPYHGQEAVILLRALPARARDGMRSPGARG